MSYLCGFSRFRSGDEGSRRMAKGEDSVGSREEEGPPLNSSKDILSHVDSIRVITWLKPVGEPRVDEIWKKFSFPPNVQVSSMSSGPRVTVCMDKDRGEMNFIY